MDSVVGTSTVEKEFGWRTQTTVKEYIPLAEGTEPSVYRDINELRHRATPDRTDAGGGAFFLW